MVKLLETDGGVRAVARALTYVSLLVGLAAAVLGALPSFVVFATPLLATSLALLMGGAFVLGLRPPAPEDPHETREDRFLRELTTNGYTLILFVVFLILLLVEALTIPATLGYLTFFGAFALSVVAYFPAIVFGVQALVALAFLHHVQHPGHEPLPRNRRIFAFSALGATALFALGSLVVQFGFATLNPERAVFVIAGGVVSAFFFVHTWTRMPGYDEISEWLETEERLRSSNLLRNIVFVFLSLTAFMLIVAGLSAVNIVPRTAGLVALGGAMIFTLPATFSVGARRFVAKLHAADEGFEETRRKARVVLSSISVALSVVGLSLGVATVLAFMAQVGGVALFRALLAFFVEFYPLLIGVAIIPVLIAVALRTRFESEEEYSDDRKAVTLFTAIFTIVLAFFGIFIGSGMAEGTGIEIENAVLAMSGGVLSLIWLVKSRALLPTTLTLIKRAVAESAQAEEEVKEDIQRRMVTTYVSALVFVVGFVGYIAATTFGAVPAPGEGLVTDAAFFGYVLIGMALLVLVVVRYFQSVNIDPRWQKKEQPVEIGRKRVTAEELHRYIIIGTSATLGLLFFAVGVLVQLQVVTNVGSLEIAKKFATDFFVFALLVGLGPYGFFHTREVRRIQAIDQKFPEFLRDLAESQRAGMTLTEAVVTSSKGSYGMLTPEIRKMAAQIEWGVSFGSALQRFAKRVRTPLVQRTVSLIVQAANAGGNVVDVLSAAADDSREIQMILKERKGSMSIYTMIIYVAFLVFMGVVAILTAQFIPEVAAAVSKADGVSIGGLQFRTIDEQAFKTLFFHAAVIQALGGGLVAGVMEGGKPVLGLKHAFIMISLAYVVFRFLIGG